MGLVRRLSQYAACISLLAREYMVVWALSETGRGLLSFDHLFIDLSGKVGVRYLFRYGFGKVWRRIDY